MRIAIIEDDRLQLENLKLLLGGEPGIKVVGVFGSAEEALPILKQAAPDVILVDLGLPGMSGVELIKRIKKEMPEVEVMAHTMFEDKENVFPAIKAGASGYILKGSSPRELIEAIFAISQGGAPMSPKIARKMILEFQDSSVSDPYILTHREKDIVKSIEVGLSYKEIADKLNISPHTVHSHIRKVYEKLNAKDRHEALQKARIKGII